MKKKILIIPSWYPNKDNTLTGSFFKEQASLLDKNNLDVKILYGIEKQISTFEYLKFLLLFFFKFRKESFLNTDYLAQDPIAYSFTAYYPKKCSIKKRLKIINKQYKKAFNVLSKNWKPELIHAQCTANAGIYAFNISKTNSIPYVIIEHQTFILNYYDRALQKAMIKALENASKTAAVSHHQKRNILMNHINCDPEIIWNLVDESKFNITPRKPNSKFTILTITYPSFIKDALTFFKSIELFSKLIDVDFEAIVVGNDSFDDLKKANSSIFKEYAKKYNVLDKCVFIPKLTREEINTQLQQSDVFVSTSISETFGIAVREAMLCGIPVITTKSGGVEDSITTETGLLVNIGDSKTIAENLLKIKTNKISFSQKNIRNHVIEQSGKEAFIKTMKAFYN